MSEQAPTLLDPDEPEPTQNPEDATHLPAIGGTQMTESPPRVYQLADIPREVVAQRGVDAEPRLLPEEWLPSEQVKLMAMRWADKAWDSAYTSAIAMTRECYFRGHDNPHLYSMPFICCKTCSPEKVAKWRAVREEQYTKSASPASGSTPTPSKRPAPEPLCQGPRILICPSGQIYDGCVCFVPGKLEPWIQLKLWDHNMDQPTGKDMFCFWAHAIGHTIPLNSLRTQGVAPAWMSMNCKN